MVKDWDTATIGDILDFKNGLNKGKDYFGQGTPIVNYTDVYKHRGLKRGDIKGLVSLERSEIKRYKVKKGDVFFTRTSETPEEVGIASVLLDDITNCVFSGFILRGRPKNDMLVPEYCKYCFSTPYVRQEIISNCTYTTRALTNGKQLSRIEIPVPEKEEQYRIAQALSDMDDLICSLENLIVKKKYVREGAMQELLTGKRRLPGFLDEWIEKELQEIGSMSAGGTPSTFNPNYWNGQINWLQSGAVQNCKIYESDVSQKITKLGLDNSSAYLIRPNSVLIAITGATCGNIGFLTFQSAANQSVVSIEPNSYCDGYFLYKLLLTKYKEIVSLRSGSAQGGVTLNTLKKFKIFIPQFEEQVAIGNIFLDMDSEIECLQSKLEKYRQMKSGMMDELLTGKVRLV